MAEANPPDQYSELDAKLLAEEKAQTEALETWLRENGSKFPLLYFQYYAVDYRGIPIHQSSNVFCDSTPKVK